MGISPPAAGVPEFRGHAWRDYGRVGYTGSVKASMPAVVIG